MRTLAGSIVGLVALFALAGCDPDQTATRATNGPAMSPGGPAGAAEPPKEGEDAPKEGAEGEEGDAEEEEEEAPYEYAYNPIGKRDPFRSFFRAVETGGVTTPATPLQRFDIDQYTLVGIIWGISDARAMVEDPEATGHVIEIGTYIGKNWGKVTQITANAVVVTEEYQTIHGDLVTNQITMDLPVEEIEQ